MEELKPLKILSLPTLQKGETAIVRYDKLKQIIDFTNLLVERQNIIVKEIKNIELHINNLYKEIDKICKDYDSKINSLKQNTQTLSDTLRKVISNG